MWVCVCIGIHLYKSILLVWISINMFKTLRFLTAWWSICGLEQYFTWCFKWSNGRQQLENMKWMVFLAMILHCKGILAKPGIMKWILVWIMPQLQDWSLHLFYLQSSMLPLCYDCPLHTDSMNNSLYKGTNAHVRIGLSIASCTSTLAGNV